MSTNQLNQPMNRLISRATMMLLTMLLTMTAQTAWAKSGPTIDLSTVHADFTAQDGDVLTMTVTQESPRQLRIYMLRLVGRHTYHSAKVIIIVKMKT